MIDIVASIVWVVFMLAGAGLEAHRFLYGAGRYTTVRQVDAAIRRHRLAMICFLLASAGAYVAGSFVQGTFIVLFGVLMNEGRGDLRKRRRSVTKEQEKASVEDARQAAAALGVSPAHLDGIDPDVLAEIRRSMETQPEPEKER